MDPATWAIIASLGIPLISSLFGGKSSEEKRLEELLDLLGPEYKYWAGKAKGFESYMEPFLKEQAGKYFGEGGLEEFKWPEEITSLTGDLGERMQYLMKYPTGLTPDERNAIMNYMVRGVKAGEAPRIEAKRKALSTMGLLGTAGEFQEIEKERRYTQEQEATTRQALAIDEINKRYEQIIGTTGMARGLFGDIMGAEQVQEILGAGRRGEKTGFLNTLMNYFGTLMGGKEGALSPYMQAIFNQMSLKQGEGGMEWLPMMLYFLLEEKKSKPTEEVRV